MRLLLVVALLLGAGCLRPSGVVSQSKTPEEPPAANQLREILDWAAADASPMAIEAHKKAEVCLQRAPDGDDDRESISRAWKHAQAASRPGLDAHEKERLWIACFSELTHGTDG